MTPDEAREIAVDHWWRKADEALASARDDCGEGIMQVEMAMHREFHVVHEPGNEGWIVATAPEIPAR